MQICFNPSRGIAIIQTSLHRTVQWPTSCFNPSRGIAIIQTERDGQLVIVPPAEFQSLTRDSNHSNDARASLVAQARDGFNPSRGIAIIQTHALDILDKEENQVSIPHAG